MSDKLDHGVCTSFLKEGILYVTGKPGNTQTLEDATIVMNAIIENYYKDVGLWMILDMTGFKSVDRDARNYYSNDKFIPVFGGVAFMTNSFPTKILANMFLGFNKPKYPVRLFTSVNDAKQWINNMKQKKRE